MRHGQRVVTFLKHSVSAFHSHVSPRLASPKVKVQVEVVPLSRSVRSLHSAGKMAGSQKPCRIGDRVQDIDTPALLVCLDKMEENVARMKKAMDKHPGIDLRPHIKTHKCPDIGRIQIKAGAVGLCCQTVTEAEAMVSGGITDVFISNQVVGLNKLRRVASLARQAVMSVCVDNDENLNDLSEAAKMMGVTIGVAIEVDIGGKRCGVEPGSDVVKLAELAASLPGVNFKGIHCYNGWNQHVRSLEERKNNVDQLVKETRKAVDALKQAGISCPYVTGGGTGSFHFEADSGVFTEVQPGSYIFMDADYAKNLMADGNFYTEFVQSLFVLTTVQSAAADGSRLVVDAGMKAVSLDSGVPLVCQYPGLTYNNGGDNHGILTDQGGSMMGIGVGRQFWLVPGHCDPTVNLYDYIVGVRDGHVECVWPVTGRGPGN